MLYETDFICQHSVEGNAFVCTMSGALLPSVASYCEVTREYLQCKRSTNSLERSMNDPGDFSFCSIKIKQKCLLKYGKYKLHVLINKIIKNCAKPRTINNKCYGGNSNLLHQAFTDH